MTSTEVAGGPVELVGQRRADVLCERATLADWQSREQAAAAELAALEELAGEQILDDPDSAGDVESRVAAVQAARRAAQRAAVAQEPRVLAAESRYFAAEAEVLVAQLAEARDALERHCAKTERLLKAIERHEGCAYVPESQLVNLRRQFGDDGPTRWRVPLALGLRNKVQHLEDQVTLVRELAAGRDPDTWVQEHRTSIVSGPSVALPDHLLGAGALVQTRKYLAQAAAARARLGELEALRDELPDKLEARAAQIRLHSPDAVVAEDYVWARLKVRLEGIDEEIDDARGVLAGVLDESSTE